MFQENLKDKVVIFVYFGVKEGSDVALEEP